MTPILSIITVNRNNASGLEKTIKSVVEQKKRNFEYIVIDGNSTDGSVAVIQKYAQHINQWISEPDTGIFNAMNKAIGMAKGEYCYFLNSDDSFVDADVLSKVFDNKQYDAPFIYGNQINDFGTHKSIVKNKGRALTLYDFYVGTIKHQATFIRRDLFDVYGLYDEGLSIVSDWKFFLLVIGLNNQQPVMIDVDIVNFAWDGVSTNPAIKEKHDIEREKVLSELISPSIRADYEKLKDLKNFEYIATRMKKSKILTLLIKLFVRIF